MPIPERLVALGGHSRVITVPVPHDCQDGFTPAYWRRPWPPSTQTNSSVFLRRTSSAIGVGNLSG